MKVLFIINPNSGRGKIKTELLGILKTFSAAGYETVVHITSRKGEAVDFIGTIADAGFERLICCGGDGTLNEVITGMQRFGVDIPIGYIPAGTTNDFAKTMGISLNMQSAAKNIVNAHSIKEIDIGKFSSEKYFSYIASFGLFTSVAYNTQQNVKNALGHVAYVLEGIASMTNIENYKISFTADGKEFSGDYIYGGITNSTSIAGMFKYDSSIVDLSDGQFEILMIKNPKTPNDLMKIIGGITTGDLSDTSIFDFCKASKIELDMPAGVTWTLDGESANGKKKLVIKNLHKKIKFIA